MPKVKEEFSAVTLIRPMDVSTIEQKAKAMTERVSNTVVENDEQLNTAAETIKLVKDLGKAVKQQKELFTKPANDIISQARKTYLPFEKACDEAEIILKRKCSVYMDKVEAERLRKQNSIADRVESGRLKEETGLRKMEDIGETIKTVSTPGATLTQKKVKVAYIIDQNLIPDEYWVVDESRVKRAAVAGAVIPGVEVREESQMAIR